MPLHVWALYEQIKVKIVEVIMLARFVRNIAVSIIRCMTVTIHVLYAMEPDEISALVVGLAVELE